ncbi:DNA primase [Listeria floridensis FSL S10-1187]|uniref:DNA primase n=1 Tax=Listeria floridensis FSL S10-1187 TaxID=1265817 RepID=A0ABN0RB84_9LIST|nr:toprim domain-containing protein [Listeria floridensis]EUJ23743.1 DNA primase [Listeria floridensis FSL S10-1187]
MQSITINGQVILIDIQTELEAFEWENARWLGDKLIANSPFRNERRPSFFVNLEGELAGFWADSGAVEPHKEKGNFVWLLALLRGWSYEMAEQYLLEKYGYLDVAKMQLKPAIKRLEPENEVVTLDGFTALPKSDYLESRGIGSEVQQLYGVGGDSEKAIMPWRTKEGLPANIKYRRIDTKDFWYERGATPLTDLVFGQDVVYSEQPDTIALCEAEIDAMSWTLLEKDVIGIAVGSSKLSDGQVELIKRLPAEKIILGADNDKAGRKLNNQAKQAFGGLFKLEFADYDKFKDANDKLKNFSELSVQ